jgi:hypothetical protein
VVVLSNFTKPAPGLATVLASVFDIFSVLHISLPFDSS